MLIDLSSPSQVAQEPDSLKDFMWEPTEVDLFYLDQRSESSDLFLLLHGSIMGGLTQDVATNSMF